MGGGEIHSGVGELCATCLPRGGPHCKAGGRPACELACDSSMMEEEDKEPEEEEECEEREEWEEADPKQPSTGLELEQGEEEGELEPSG